MQHGIVEGDSVFTEPVRRIARGVGRLFGRKSGDRDGDAKPDSMFGSDAPMDELPDFPERPDHIPPPAEPETQDDDGSP